MRNDDYPLPAHSLSIWKVGHTLYVGVPPSREGVRGTTLKITLDRCGVECSAFGQPLASQRGWRVLLDVLAQRERDGRSAPLGNAGAPVQYDVEKILRAMGSAAPRVTRVGPTTLDDLGLED
jgi:hypothetical protein